MSVRYRYGIGIIPYFEGRYRYNTDTVPIPKTPKSGYRSGSGSVRDRYGIGIRWHMLIPSGNNA
ncbi:hypothetical protein Hanom_Chr10g00918641 [Helianthus anomalus]